MYGQSRSSILVLCKSLPKGNHASLSHGIIPTTIWTSMIVTACHHPHARVALDPSDIFIAFQEYSGFAPGLQVPPAIVADETTSTIRLHERCYIIGRHDEAFPRTGLGVVDSPPAAGAQRHATRHTRIIADVRRTGATQTATLDAITTASHLALFIWLSVHTRVELGERL